MKIYKNCLFAFFTFLVLFGFKLTAQSVTFIFVDDSSNIYNINDVQKLTFTQSTMNLFLIDGNIYSWDLQNINNQIYSESSIEIEELINNVNSISFKIYPNPFIDELELNYNLSEQSNVSVEISDLQGNILFTDNFGIQNQGKHLEKIDFSNFSKGQYTIIIHYNNNSIIKTVIKQ
jgi:hypothetical protein